MKPDAHKSQMIEYMDAAEEDVRSAQALLSMKIPAYHNMCMLSARSSEKMLKARLIFEGKEIEWAHDQRKLVRELGDFDGCSRAMEIARALSPYAVQANYPSAVRSNLDDEDASEAYGMAMEIISMVHPYGIRNSSNDDRGDESISEN